MTGKNRSFIGMTLMAVVCALLVFGLAPAPTLASAEEEDITLYPAADGDEIVIVGSWENGNWAILNTPTGYKLDTEFWGGGTLSRASEWGEYDTSIMTLLLRGNPTSIGWGAFSGFVSISEVSIPNSVTSIGDYAFEDCSGLESVVIPGNVQSIGSSAFSGCTGLTSLDIPYGVTYINSYAFEDCSSLTDVVIPNSVSTMRGSTFKNCSGLTSAVLPDGLQYIEGSTFFNCYNLTDVTLPSELVSIGAWAFYNCGNLKTLTIPDQVTKIHLHAFEGCSGLKTINIPHTVNMIGSQAFANCSDLQEVYYDGYKAEWAALDKASDWDLNDDNLWVIHCLDGDIATPVTVTFVAGDGASQTPEAQTVERGTMATRPDDPTKEGMVLEGWYAEGQDRAFDFEYTPIMADLTLTARWVETQYDFSKITYSTSLSLNELIAINFYVSNLPAGTVPSDYHVEYWIGANQSEKVSAPLSGTNNNYFQVAVFASKQMTDMVHIRVYHNSLDIPIKTVDYTIRDYCDRKINQSADENLVALCQSVLDYGTYSQLFFGYNTDNLANANHGENTEEVVASVVIPEQYKVKSTGKADVISKTAASVSLDSQVTISFYFTPKKGYTASDIATYFDNKEITEGSVVVDNRTGSEISREVAPDGRVHLKITGIAPMYFDRAFAISAGSQTARRTIEYSVLSFAYSKQNSTTPYLADTCKALYNYWNAAKAYLN